LASNSIHEDESMKILFKQTKKIKSLEADLISLK